MLMCLRMLHRGNKEKRIHGYSGKAPLELKILNKWSLVTQQRTKYFILYSIIISYSIHLGSINSRDWK